MTTTTARGAVRAAGAPGSATAPGEEPPPDPSGEGTVVVDIGGTRGAAIIFTPASLTGAEMEIRRAGTAWDGTHTGIRRRELRDTVAHAAMFGSLEAGAYQVRLRGVAADRADAGSAIDLTVAGGEVVQVEWPGT